MLTTFVKGTNMGPYEAAKHIPGVSGHELSYVANRHFSIVLLNEAVADLVNAHARLGISRAWGDGTAVAADGTHMDTYLKPGSIAYHHISDTYIALFTHFIPCGVWEAVYIIEGLLKNTSEVKPTAVHADAQGRPQPVFALAHLLGLRPDAQDQKLEGHDVLPAVEAERVRAHRLAVRGSRPEHHRLRSARVPVPSPDAGGRLSARGRHLLLHAAKKTALGLAQELHLHRVP
ncbi:hypothetical protein GCM10010207_68920 [Streptomyces atratus]|nr:hypothetical protein GCM10010207_68920 [Streptomyces atratus]